MIWPANWSDQIQSDQVRAKIVCCKLLTTLSLDQWLLNHQGSVLAPYGLPPTANRWPHWGGLTTLQRCSQCILQPQQTGQYIYLRHSNTYLSKHKNIYHSHYHLVLLIALSSLILSHHLPLSSISLGRFSRLYSVST